MNVLKKISFILFVFCTSCSSLSFKEKIFRNMLIASSVGIIIGQQEKDNKGGYSALYGSADATVAAVSSILYYDPDKEIDLCSGTSKEIADSLENAVNGHDTKKYFQNQNQQKLMGSRTGSGIKNFSAMPDKYKKLIEPGEWKISQISEWEQIDDFTLVHKTELLEVKPTQIQIQK